MSERLELTLHCSLDEIPRLVEAVEGFFESNGLPLRMGMDLVLAIDEMATNVITYGYGDDAAATFDVIVSVDGSEVTVEIIDCGKPFNPLEIPEPDTGSSLEDRPIGGLGVHLARRLMTRVEYRRESGKNRLVMHKRSGDDAPPAAGADPDTETGRDGTQGGRRP